MIIDVNPTVRLDVSEAPSSADSAQLSWTEFGSPLMLRMSVANTPELHVWLPRSEAVTSLPVPWDPPTPFDSHRGAPIVSLLGREDTNVATLACCSCAVSGTVKVYAATPENAVVELCVEAVSPLCESSDAHALLVYLDDAPRHFSESVAQVAREWERQIEPLLAVPSHARAPHISTWYSHAQSVTARDVEANAALAAELGFAGVLVDDGWQTPGTQDGYTKTGDWRFDPLKFPSPAGHIEAVRSTGLTYTLWFAPGIVADDTELHGRLADDDLDFRPRMRAFIADPRSPSVRHALADAATRLMRHGLDGLKIDFVDHFWTRADRPDAETALAVETLLQEIRLAVESEYSHGDDMLVEFRQDYHGPRMWRYCNVIRANDCPGDVVANRVRTIDLRLINRSRAIHSDMINISVDTPADDIAVAMINTIFATPQVCAPLSSLSEEQLQTLRWWLGLVRKHQDVLLGGDLRPYRPDLRYPLVTARRSGTDIIAVFADVAVDLRDDLESVLVVNGDTDRVLVESPREHTATVHDHRGHVAAHVEVRRGAQRIAVPRGGVIAIGRQAGPG